MIRVHRATLVLALTCAVLVQGEDAPIWPRPRRQFPSQEWVPLTQPCPTCRPLADPQDTRQNINDIGLVPPRPPPASRQVHGTGNFFTQGFQPQSFQQQRPFLDFSINNGQFGQNPASVVQFPPAQQFFPPQQQAAFLPQTYLNNPQLLLNENPQLLPLVSNPQLLLAQKTQTPASNSVTSGEKKEESQIRFKQDQIKSSTKPPQNIRIEQEPAPPVTRLELPANNGPAQFLQPQPPPQFQQFQFHNRPEQQPLLQINPSDPFLTPPPFRSLNDSEIQIPGLEKEEIQLLYVPVETLRQRGHLQGHQVDDFNLNVNTRPFQQIIQTPTGHFITQAPSPSPQSQQINSIAPITPPAVFTQGPPLRDPPQQFATERPETPPTTEQIITIQPRPVSTVRQQTQSDSLRFTARPSTRPSDPTTTQTKGTTKFLSNEHLTKVTESLLNEVTPPIPQPTLPPPSIQPQRQFPQFQTFPQQQQVFQQFQNFPPPPQQTFQQLQKAPEPETQLPQAPRHRFTAAPPPPPTETVTEIIPQTTTLQPHQPPLSIYMASNSANVKIVDVLRALKGADSIAVIDNFAPNNPKVFVGPANLNPPRGFGKFELPYLSNLEHNRVERRINTPFFVAPLNFNPPNGYSKIPFPAPHVGSVVVSTEIADRSQNFFEQKQQTVAAPEPEIVEPEITTTVLPETTTTIRSRGRRPNTYRNSARKPVNSRQRVTIRPFEDETTPPITENQVSPQDFLREPSEERKKTFPRRQRIRTTTEPVQETVPTEPPAPVNAFVPQELPSEIPPPQEIPQEIPQPPVPRLVEPVHPPFDFRQPQPPADFHQLPPPPRTRNQFRRPQFTETEFVPPPPPPSFEFRPPQYTSTDFRSPQPQPISEPDFPIFRQPPIEQQRFPQLPQTNQETQGLFEVSTQSIQQQSDEPVIENNGDSGQQQPNVENQVVTTIQPISSTQFFENVQTQTPREETFRQQTEPTRRIKTTTTTTTTTTTSAPTTEEKETEVEEIEKHVDVPRKSSRFSYPNVPGVKSYPNPGSVKVKSHVRSRPRYTTPSTSTTAEEENVPVEVSATGEEATPTTEATSRTTSKYQSHFNRPRKPLRPNPTTARPETTTPGTTRSYTVRPLRRSTLRTSIATKRIRKPTTPSSLDTDEVAEEVPEQTFHKKVRPSFAPSGVSNEVYDEQPAPVTPKPKARKPYFHKQKNVEVTEDSATSPSPSTKTYQERKDEVTSEDLRVVDGGDFGPSEPAVHQSDDQVSTQVASGPSGPSGPEEVEEKKVVTEERKKAKYSELSKKPRRRLRVRVQKRPHDNFEAAESQNHGSVSNQLVAQPTSTPDIYRFSQGADFEFDNSGKFIGTQHKGHVRNITAAILENTSTFSSPGTDAEVQKVTIANEPTTNLPETVVTERTQEAVTNTESAEAKEDPIEVTTLNHETTRFEAEEPTTEESVESTTSSEEFATTVPVEDASSTNSPSSEEFEEIKKQPKVLRTSTTTQVSHETEICYKGKCIKTNSDNPDQALKQLVESANLEEMARAKS